MAVEDLYVPLAAGVPPRILYKQNMEGGLRAQRQGNRAEAQRIYTAVIQRYQDQLEQMPAHPDNANQRNKHAADLARVLRHGPPEEKPMLWGARKALGEKMFPPVM